MAFQQINLMQFNLATKKVNTLYLKKQIMIREKNTMDEFFERLYHGDLASAMKIYGASDSFIDMHLRRIWRSLEN
ncbi:hypothetical protein [Heyndrickxia acidicola]|uniref:Uncharacterized protein n=1 Tax=Heyndrickxia acidicola TaxID=209389 RepID=A0ABU6MBB2_9BACI|nr:hypothetical protein [Heyndrickxia acidicola]MED1201972.1 hypothetical protein [Heyndrickxia acidicola]